MGYATTVEERFAKFAPDWGTAEGCWEWTGTTVGHMGYGNMAYKGRSVLAHRVSYMEHVGEIPDGLIVMHRCDNPLCVRPDHLALGTVADNQMDMAAKGRSKRGRTNIEALLAKPCSKCGGQRVLGGSTSKRVRCPRLACRGGH